MEGTEAGCTTQTLGEQVQPQVVESPLNVELVESDNCLTQARENIIEDTEVVITSQDLKNKEESEAVGTEESSQDSFSEGRIHTEAVSTEESSQDSFSEGSIHIKVSEPFSLSEDLDLYLSDDSNEDKIENQTGTSPIEQNKNILSEQGEAVVSIGLDRKPNLADETESRLQSQQPKRRGRPPKSTKTGVQLQNHQPRRRGRPPKSTNNKYIVSINKLPNEIKPQKNLDMLEKPASSSNDFSKRKTETVSQTSHDSSFADEKQRNKNISTEEQSCSINDENKRTSLKILSEKDLIDRTLAKLTSGNFRSKLNTVSNGGNPEEKGKLLDFSSQNIPGDSKIKSNNLLNEVCKKPIDTGKVNLKSQRVTVIYPTELINHRLEKSTHKKDFQVKEKATYEKANSKHCDDKSSQTKQNTLVERNSEVSILSSEKKETLLRELIDRTLAKVTTSYHCSKKKTDELESSDSFEESLTENNEEKILNLRPLVRRTFSKPFVGFYKDKRDKRTKKLASKNKEGELQNSISFCEDDFEISNKKEILEGKESKIKTTMNQTTLKKTNLGHEENTQPKTKNLVGKVNIYQRVVDSLSKKNKRASLKPPVQEENVQNEDNTPLADELPLAKVKHLLKTELDEKNNCSSVPALTHTKPESKIRNLLKSKQPNSRVKGFKSNDLCTKTKTAKGISGKPLKKLVFNKKGQFRHKKQTAMPPKKNAKRKLNVHRTKLLHVTDLEACIGLDSLTENRMTWGEKILEDQKGLCSYLSTKISSNGKVELEEQLKAMPRVVLQDCRKIGISLSNEELTIKNKMQDKNNLTLKPETHPSDKTDNQVTVDSGYFGQLELSPSPKSALINRKPHMSLPSSKTNFGLGKDSQMNEIVSIDDDDDDDDDDDYVDDDLDTYTDALPSAHELDGLKECSVSSSQKQGSIENLPSSVAPRCSNVSLPLKSLSTSPTDRKSRRKNLPISPHKKSVGLKKGLHADEIVTIEDYDDEKGLKISSAASLPSHNLDRMKKYSVSSSTSHSKKMLINEKGTHTKQKSNQFYYDLSQKSELVNNIKTTNIQGQDLNKGECKSVSGNRCLPIEITARTFPISTQGKSGKVFQLQSNEGTRNFFVPKSVQQSDDFIISKLKDYFLKNNFLPNQQLKPTNQVSPSEVVKQYSLNNNIASECLTNSVVPNNTSLKNDIQAKLFEVLAKVDQSSVLPNVRFSAPVLSQPTLPIPLGSIGSAPVFPPQAIPIATGPKKYYFTPLFVLDGEKIVPLNEKNSPQCIAGKSEDSNSKLKYGSKSTVITTSQIVIDTKTIKPLPNLDFGAVSASSVVPSSITNAKFEMISKSQSLSINERIMDSSGSFTVSSTQKDLKSPTKRKQACLEEVGSETQLSQIVHCSSSIHSNTVHDHLYYAKRKQLEAPAVTMFISSDQDGKKNTELHTKRKQPCSIEARSQNEINQDVHCSSSTLSNIECDHLSAPKRRRNQASPDLEPRKMVNLNKSVQISCALDKNSSNHFEEASVSSTYPSNECGEITPLQRRIFQETQKISLPVQSCEKMSEISSNNCYDSNPNDKNLIHYSGSKGTSKKEMSVSMGQIENEQTEGQKNIEKQLKGKKENFSSSNVCKMKEITQEFSLPVSLSKNLNKQSTNTLKEEKQMHTKKTNVKTISKRTKSKEEELEECLDGVPPFIRDVFKCENIRDGFDNKDLIFVLSLLSDIEEMTSSQRVIFQSRAVEILNDVFKSPMISSKKVDNL